MKLYKRWHDFCYVIELCIVIKNDSLYHLNGLLIRFKINMIDQLWNTNNILNLQAMFESRTFYMELCISTTRASFVETKPDFVVNED